MVVSSCRLVLISYDVLEAWSLGHRYGTYGQYNQGISKQLLSEFDKNEDLSGRVFSGSLDWVFKCVDATSSASTGKLSSLVETVLEVSEPSEDMDIDSLWDMTHRELWYAIENGIDTIVTHFSGPYRFYQLALTQLGSKGAPQIEIINPETFISQVNRVKLERAFDAEPVERTSADANSTTSTAKPVLQAPKITSEPLPSYSGIVNNLLAQAQASSALMLEVMQKVLPTVVLMLLLEVYPDLLPWLISQLDTSEESGSVQADVAQPLADVAELAEAAEKLLSLLKDVELPEPVKQVIDAGVEAIAALADANNDTEDALVAGQKVIVAIAPDDTPIPDFVPQKTQVSIGDETLFPPRYGVSPRPAATDDDGDTSSPPASAAAPIGAIPNANAFISDDSGAIDEEADGDDNTDDGTDGLPLTPPPNGTPPEDSPGGSAADGSESGSDEGAESEQPSETDESTVDNGPALEPPILVEPQLPGADLVDIGEDEPDIPETDPIDSDSGDSIPIEEPDIDVIPGDSPTEPGDNSDSPDLIEADIIYDADDPNTELPDITADSGNIVIENFTGVGVGADPADNGISLSDIDVLTIVDASLSPETLLLTQEDDDLVITFEGIDGVTITLKDFELETFDNLPISNDDGSSVGNISFTFLDEDEFDSVDVFNESVEHKEVGSDGLTNEFLAQFSFTDTFFTGIAGRNQVFGEDKTTFLNDNTNIVSGLDNSNDVINGQGGDDILWGKSGQDILRGGAGDDILHGGLDDDLLTGNAGVDLFILTPDTGTDTITDFALGEDKIVLQDGLSISDLEIQSLGSDTAISVSGQAIAILKGINAGAFVQQIDTAVTETLSFE